MELRRKNKKIMKTSYIDIINVFDPFFTRWSAFDGTQNHRVQKVIFVIIVDSMGAAYANLDGQNCRVILLASSCVDWDFVWFGWKFPNQNRLKFWY